MVSEHKINEFLCESRRPHSSNLSVSLLVQVQAVLLQEGERGRSHIRELPLGLPQRAQIHALVLLQEYARVVDVAAVESLDKQSFHLQIKKSTLKQGIKQAHIHSGRESLELRQTLEVRGWPATNRLTGSRFECV